MTGQERIGKYEIIEEIGRGGFAVVYKARDPGLDRVVALKVLAPHHTWDPASVKRFRREAQATARLRHPHVVTIHEVGESEGQLYIAMEYLPGGSLSERLTGEPLPLEVALPILEQVAKALDYAHKGHLVHRDVKPANILFGEDGRVVLADFGLVKSLLESGITLDGAWLGTPVYMAPEQCRENADVSPASDIYSLGVVAYEMLAGHAPFTGQPLAVLHAHVHEPPPDPRSRNESLPASVADALLKTLSKSPGDRYSTATAMVEALYQVQATAKVQVGGEQLPLVEVVTPSGQRVRGWLINVLQNPALQGIGAIVTVVALFVAIGTCLWPDIGRILFPSPTSIPTATYTATPTPTSASTATPTPVATIAHLIGARVDFIVFRSDEGQQEIPSGGTLSLRPGEAVLISMHVSVNRSPFPRPLAYNYFAPKGNIPEEHTGPEASYIAPEQAGPDVISVKITDPATSDVILRSLAVVVSEEPS